MSLRLSAGLACVLLIVACSAKPTGVSLAPDGQSPAPAGKVIAGPVKGTRVGPTTRVALLGAFTDRRGDRLDALGNPPTSDALLSVPVVEGKFGLELPVPPRLAAGGEFTVMAFNDGNGNGRFDPDEAKAVGTHQLRYVPFVGYSLLRAGGITSQDQTLLEQMAIQFD